MKIKFFDIIIIVLALILAGFSWVALAEDESAPDTVLISADGKEQEIALPANEQISVNGVEIIIDGYTAYVASSDCPDKTCVKTGELTLSGQSSVCLPNRVMLTLQGNGGVHVTVR